MRKWWSVDAKDKPGFVFAVLAELVGQASVALEGNLANLQLLEHPEASTAESADLRRVTSSPSLDFVVFPVSAKVLEHLKRKLQGPSLWGTNGNIVRVTAACGSAVVFAADDNFAPGFVSVSEPLTEAFLQRLQSQGVVRSYRSRNASAA